MLLSKRPRVIHRKTDWYSAKDRLHFDRPLTREEAERLVSDPVAVSRHPFLPLIAFSKKQRRYRRSPGCKTPRSSTKNRDLAYPGNHDGHIFAYYAEKLGALYEAELAACGLEKVVIGYRKGASNIRLAREAFTEIAERGECVALALDIKGFFDNISHQVLKDCWAHLLGTNGTLPDDHYAVFKALTRADKIDRGELLRRLGNAPNTRDRDLPRPLCSIHEFRRLRNGGGRKLVQCYNERKGIPQGTPLSAMAANICMLWFDRAVRSAVLAVGASYRRYSDDILVICPPEHAAALEAAVEEAFAKHTKTLRLNTDKREEARFALPGPSIVATPPKKVAKPLQYLGFIFDGRRILLRSGTLSRYYRRMANSVRAAKVKVWQIKRDNLSGRNVVHKRDLLATHTHLGTDNFVSGYMRTAAMTMGPLGSKAIKRQLARHVAILTKKLRPER
jgi:RNA-directed DNA polymerase